MKKNTRKGEKNLFSFFITNTNKNTLDKAAKFNGNSRGDIINTLIETKLRDPIKYLKEKKREKIIEANQIADRIKHLENLRDRKQ